MLKITNGQHNLTVSLGAYRNYYQGIGYRPVETLEEPENLEQGNTHTSEGTLPPDHSDTEDPENEVTEDFDDGEETPLSEIPLSEMTLSQLLTYAEELGLEYEGIPTQKNLRKLIRAHLK